ncbi:MAG: exodeoxyribonuclease V subunit alpha [Solirubrobacteraceae bacterium]
MSALTDAGDPAALHRDPFDARVATVASGLLREFNRAGVLDAADVHVARTLGRLAGERGESALLAAALAVRGLRLGHVLVALDRISDTAAVQTDQPVDVATLPWPEPGPWITAVAASPLAAGDGPRPLRLEGAALYLARCFTEEVEVAAALRELADRVPAIDEQLLDDGVARLFADEPGGRQALAARTAVGRRLAVVAGGPGTGKTTTIARIVALVCEQARAAGEPPPLVALAAPTGRAAARLEEAVHAEAAGLPVDPPLRERLLDLRAQTLHRLLGLRPGASSRGAEGRLAHDLVVVDETSMVSLALMAALTAALRRSARLVLVGDPDQLASIEAGSVLADIVRGPSRPGIVTLDRVHRFGGAIAALAAAIRAGDGDRTIEILRSSAGELTWLPAGAAAARPPAAVVEPALAAAQETIAAAREGQAQLALARLAAFRILCAHRRGPYGAEMWSELIEARLGAAGAGPERGARWYPGRPLLVTESDPELRLANGDAGVVVALGEGDVACAFTRGGETVLHGWSRLGAIQTVYASTIHRSQGSQFDAAAVLLPEPGSRLLTRELLYTAVTRARRELIVAGEEESIRRAVARPAARASGLSARLWSAT